MAAGRSSSNCRSTIEPPKLTPEELNECYGWADVVLVVSRWEGLPLTILEAMRLGAVVCTTAVGAVAEAVSHKETGFLLPRSGTAGDRAGGRKNSATPLPGPPGAAARLPDCGRSGERLDMAELRQGFLHRLDRLTAA